MKAPVIIRVFISSTFKDFAAEREVLQTEVFPELARRCKAGAASFLGVDLRWGISRERGQDNRTVSTCIEEIRRCQRLSPRPNFLILLGQRYGWIPLPERLAPDLHERIKEWMEQNEPAALATFQDCYERDDNILPDGAWVLRPRRTTIPDVDGKPDASVDAAHASLQEVLARAAQHFEREAKSGGGYSEADHLLLTASATHQEIVEGFSGLRDGCEGSQHVLAWCRHIDWPKGACDDSSTRKDLDDYRDKHEDKCRELASSLAKKLGDNFRQETARLDELREFGKTKARGSYLDGFRQWAIEMLWLQIEAKLGERPTITEEDLHRDFARRHAIGVRGREAELQALDAWLDDKAGTPVHLVKAPGGMGKTSLLAKWVEQRLREEKGEHFWMVRFIGASASIGSPESLLQSLWPPDSTVAEACRGHSRVSTSARRFLEALGQGDVRKRSEAVEKAYSLLLSLDSKWISSADAESAGDAAAAKAVAKEAEDARKVLERHFIASLSERRRALLQSMPVGMEKPGEEALEDYLTLLALLWRRPLVLVLDGLDQLEQTEGSVALAGLLSVLAHRGCAGEGYRVLASCRDEEAQDTLKGLPREAWRALAKEWLGKGHQPRTLGETQFRWLDAVGVACAHNPLALRLVIERARRLRSCDEPPVVRGSIDALVGDLFDHLSQPSEHGDLAKCAIAFLAVSRAGLPEEALLQALALDQQVRAWFKKALSAEEHPWSLEERGLPPILWSRLQLDIEPFLARGEVLGAPVLRFFHRAFRESAIRWCRLDGSSGCAGQTKSAILANIAMGRLQGKAATQGEADQPLQLPADLDGQDPCGWSLGELPWLLQRAGRAGDAETILAMPAYAMAKLQAQGGAAGLVNDWRRQGGRNGFGRLVLRDPAALMLSADPCGLLLQWIGESPVQSPIRVATFLWLQQSRRQRRWVYNLLAPDPDPRLVRGVSLRGESERCHYGEADEFKLRAHPDGRTIVWNPTSPLVRIVDFEHPVPRLERLLDDAKTDRPKVVEVLPVGSTGRLLVRYAKGPLILWHHGKVVARLYERELASENPRWKSCILGVEVRDECTVAVAFDSDLAGIWRLPPESAAVDEPLDTYTDQPEHFNSEAASKTEQADAGTTPGAVPLGTAAESAADFEANHPSAVRSVLRRPGGIAQATHEDGVLRIWDTRQDPIPTRRPSASCLVSLAPQEFLAFAEDRLVCWRLAPGSAEPCDVWLANEDHGPDRVRAALQLGTDALVSCGAQWLRLWDKTASGWKVSHQLGVGPLRGKALLRVDDSRCLVEFGDGPYAGRGSRLALVQRRDGDWACTVLQLQGQEASGLHHHIFSPVMDDGSVLFRAVRKEPGANAFTEYNLKTGALRRVDQATAQTWLTEHQKELDACRHELLEHLRSLAAQVQDGSREALSQSLDENLFDWPTDSLMPTPASPGLAVDRNRAFGYTSLQRIAIQGGPNQQPARHQHGSKRTLLLNHLATSGQLVLIDEYDGLQVLQLMCGAEAAVSAGIG